MIYLHVSLPHWIQSSFGGWAVSLSRAPRTIPDSSLEAEGGRSLCIHHPEQQLGMQVSTQHLLSEYINGESWCTEKSLLS